MKKLKTQKTTTKTAKQAPQVALIMGSESDWSTMQDAARILKEFKVPFETKILSAHRTPIKMMEYAQTARARKIRVIIAGAGGAAHLPGMIASMTELPVIGVPVAHGPLSGKDALFSIVQMPKGVPVATVAIGNSTNAALLAIQILGTGSEDLLDQITEFKAQMRKSVESQRLPV